MYPGFLFVCQKQVEKQDVSLRLKKASNNFSIGQAALLGILTTTKRRFTAQKPVTSGQSCQLAAKQHLSGAKWESSD